jgi:DNA-binding response OmpR family regulator
MNRVIENFLAELDKNPQKYYTKAEIHELVLISQRIERYVKSKGILLDRSRNTIQFEGAEPKQVQNIMFKLLAYLIENENEAVNKDTLLNDVWGDDVVVTPRTIDVAICKLRQIVGNRIHTIKKVGYMFRT